MNTPTSTATCPSTDDAGAFEGSLYTLDSSGNLTVNFDAGNGGIDLGPTHLPDGGLAHVYEWPCIETYDCAVPRDGSITFESANGVSGWTPISMNFDNGSSCGSATDAGGTSCCISCSAQTPGSVPCGNACISNTVQCTAAAGCACD